MTDEYKINLNDGKRKEKKKTPDRDAKHTTLSVKQDERNVIAWTYMAASGTRSLVFIDDVTADRSSRMNCEGYRAVVSAPIQTNASTRSDSAYDSIDNDPKHATEGTRQFLKQRNVIFFNGLDSHLISACFSVTEEKP